MPKRRVTPGGSKRVLAETVSVTVKTDVLTIKSITGKDETGYLKDIWMTEAPKGGYDHLSMEFEYNTLYDASFFLAWTTHIYTPILFVTELGTVVSTSNEKIFWEILDYEFEKKVEDLDDVLVLLKGPKEKLDRIVGKIEHSMNREKGTLLDNINLLTWGFTSFSQLGALELEGRKEDLIIRKNITEAQQTTLLTKWEEERENRENQAIYDRFEAQKIARQKRIDAERMRGRKAPSVSSFMSWQVPVWDKAHREKRVATREEVGALALMTPEQAEFHGFVVPDIVGMVLGEIPIDNDVEVTIERNGNEVAPERAPVKVENPFSPTGTTKILPEEGRFHFFFKTWESGSTGEWIYYGSSRELNSKGYNDLWKELDQRPAITIKVVDTTSGKTVFARPSASSPNRS